MLQQTINAIQPLNQEAMAQAQNRQNQLTKPAGSLGRLESLSIQIAGMTGQLNPALANRAVIVAAGDHGVTAEGVSAFPSAVTPQMVLNFLNEGAAINVLARQADARVLVLDAGVAAELPEHPSLINAKVAFGTQNFAVGPAMTREQAIQSIEAGIAVVTQECQNGLNLVGTGDMGIGNTTPSSAICALLTQTDIAEVTGRGTGIDYSGWEHKVKVINRAIATNQPNIGDPLDVDTQLGPLASRAQYDKVLAAIERARSEGGKRIVAVGFDPLDPALANRLTTPPDPMIVRQSEPLHGEQS